MSEKAQPERAEQTERAKRKPLLSPPEDEALRTLREVARVEARRRVAPIRLDRSNRYVLPQ